VKLDERKKSEMEGQLAQLERSKFTLQEVEKGIRELEKDISNQENTIKQFDSLLYQNISNDPDVIKKVYSYLSSDLANLDKSNIIKAIDAADLPLTFFDGKIDVSTVEIKKPKTIKELQEEIDSKGKELKEKRFQQDAIKNRDTLQNDIDVLKKSISEKSIFIEKIKNKPLLVNTKNENETTIGVSRRKVAETEKRIADKDNEITR